MTSTASPLESLSGSFVRSQSRKRSSLYLLQKTRKKKIQLEKKKRIRDAQGCTPPYFGEGIFHSEETRFRVTPSSTEMKLLQDDSDRVNN